MTNIYIDANVIVASEIRGESNHKESKKFIEYVLQNKDTEIRFFTSIFTFLELSSAIIRRTRNKDKAYSLLYRINKTWKSSINPLPLIFSKKSSLFTELIDNLVETSIKFKTSAGDTVHAHAVAENQIDYFITWNKKDFKILGRKLRIKVLTPDEVLIELTKLKKYRKDHNTFSNFFKSSKNYLTKMKKHYYFLNKEINLKRKLG